MSRRILCALVLASLAACSDDPAPLEADSGAGEPQTPTVDAAPAVDAYASACLGTPVEPPNEGWPHVPVGTAISYASEPPASGPHFPIWARYQVHTAPLARGYWVHNIEHGAIALLYRPDAPQAEIDELIATYEAIPVDPDCGHRQALVAPDPELTATIAVVAANAYLAGDCVDRAAILHFAAARRERGPENVCTEGFVP
jgi:hypothetical protein